VGCPAGIDRKLAPYVVKDRKMPKMKTKSGTKKRFKVTGGGGIKFQPANKRHNMRKRPQKMKRNARGTTMMAECDKQIVLKYMPYAR
jgi:large subunit ribosomal protein L35